MTPVQVFNELLEIMSSDSNFKFDAPPEHTSLAIPVIESLTEGGYFRDNPNDLEGSYWMAAAGEELEAKEFFKSKAEDYEKLSLILNSVFEDGSAAQLITDLGRV